jgi:hypothetical protein
VDVGVEEGVGVNVALGRIEGIGVVVAVDGWVGGKSVVVAVDGWVGGKSVVAGVGGKGVRLGTGVGGVEPQLADISSRTEARSVNG